MECQEMNTGCHLQVKCSAYCTNSHPVLIFQLKFFNEKFIDVYSGRVISSFLVLIEEGKKERKEEKEGGQGRGRKGNRGRDEEKKKPVWCFISNFGHCGEHIELPEQWHIHWWPLSKIIHYPHPLIQHSGTLPHKIQWFADYFRLLV